MKLMIKNAEGTLAKELTSEQFAVVHDDIVAMMNAALSGQKSRLTDDAIRDKLEKAGLPIDFAVGAEPVKAKARRR